jgi:hypothetical protein
MTAALAALIRDPSSFVVAGRPLGRTDRQTGSDIMPDWPQDTVPTMVARTIGAERVIDELVGAYT